MIAGAGGAMRARGRRATAIRFQQFGEVGSYGIARLSGRRARGQRRACEIDLRGARPAPAACAALCVAMDGRRQPTSMAGHSRRSTPIRAKTRSPSSVTRAAALVPLGYAHNRVQNQMQLLAKTRRTARCKFIHQRPRFPTGTGVITFAPATCGRWRRRLCQTPC